ncbi:unnamed protein product, partial [Heterotrigona itama]
TREDNRNILYSYCPCILCINLKLILILCPRQTILYHLLLYQQFIYEASLLCIGDNNSN